MNVCCNHLLYQVMIWFVYSISVRIKSTRYYKYCHVKRSCQSGIEDILDNTIDIIKWVLVFT